MLDGYLRCIQCSILLHLTDICFIPYICFWKISQIQTCLCVVIGSVFASTSAAAFIRSSASHPVSKIIESPLMGAGGFDTICTAVCNHRDSSTDCRMCRLVPPWSVCKVVLVPCVVGAVTDACQSARMTEMLVWFR